MTGVAFDVAAARARFSSLRDGFAYFDAPGGTQVPDEVADAVRAALVDAAGNLGAPYRTGRAVEEILERAKADGGRFLGCSPGEVSFGMNMTTLNFAVTRVVGRELREGDEIVTTQLDHDGGVAPWVELAEDRGLVVKVAPATAELTVDHDAVEQLVTDRTRVIAFAWASNATGTLADAARLCRLARDAGALSWIDAVHYAAHEPIDVAALGCDVLLCSPYKFCGPHLGLAYVREELAARWRPYKARPSPASPSGRRFETGTLPYELLAGFSAAVAYLDSLGGLAALRGHERALGERLLAGLPDRVTLYGPSTMAGRAPTFLFEVDGVPAERVARSLAEQGIGLWYAADWYCVSLAPRLPASTLRAGIAHYNTADEVDRLLGALAAAS